MTGAVKCFCAQFLSDDTGATAIEYGLIAGGVSLVVIGAVNQLGVTVKLMMFELTAAAMSP